VADEREPTGDGAAQETLSLAERLARAYHDWLHDNQRHRQNQFEPIGIVLFAVIAGVVLVIATGFLLAFANVLSQDAWTVLGVATEWAQLPVAVVLLGASLLGWYHCTRSCDEYDRYLNQAEPDQDATADIDREMTLVLRRLNRARLALGCIGVLGLVTAVAAIATVVWELHSSVNFSGRAPWYGKVAYVAEGLSAIIPALACLVISTRAWARASFLLLADEPDDAYEDEHPAPVAP
jgi:lysylphosphatidylglycerol synthetase-like protein (DUF2156 family)